MDTLPLGYPTPRYPTRLDTLFSLKYLPLSPRRDIGPEIPYPPPQKENGTRDPEIPQERTWDQETGRYPIPSPHEQTNTRENITFQQLMLRAVKTKSEVVVVVILHYRPSLRNKTSLVVFWFVLTDNLNRSNPKMFCSFAGRTYCCVLGFIWFSMGTSNAKSLRSSQNCTHTSRDENVVEANSSREADGAISQSRLNQITFSS